METKQIQQHGKKLRALTFVQFSSVADEDKQLAADDQASELRPGRIQLLKVDEIIVRAENARHAARDHRAGFGERVRC